MKRKLTLTSFLITIACTLNAQTADEVIAHYVNFIGGAKKWRTIKTIITSGEYDYGGMKFPFTAYSKAPNAYKFVVPLNGKFYTQAFDGKQGWKIDAFKNETKPTMLKGKEATAMANESDVSLEPAFINFKRKGHRVVLEGKDSISGAYCYKIKFIKKDGDDETYYFDASTGAIVLKIAPSKNTEMQGAVLNTLYSDYRDIGGVKIPFSSVSRLGDQNILTVRIEKAVLNQPIAEKEFKP